MVRAYEVAEAHLALAYCGRAMGTTFRVASANLHAGIDGWGRPFDAAGAIAAIECDVLLLQELWTPLGGASIAHELATSRGWHIAEAQMATGRLGTPHPEASAAWLSKKGFVGHDHSLYLDQYRSPTKRTLASARYDAAAPGSWGVAIVSRFPLSNARTYDLAYLSRDRSMRRPLGVTADIDGDSVEIICAHMSHLTYGSPRHFLHLAKRLTEDGTTRRPGVLGGDMNLWGPPVAALMRGWRRSVRGRTWPAWRPHSQLDHLLVTRSIEVHGTEVLPDFGSDHLAVRATFAATSR